MKKKRPVKCGTCGESFRREDVEYDILGSRYHHRSCLNKRDSQEVKEQNDRKKFLDYYKSIYEEEANYALVVKQLKEFSKRGMTISGIHGTLYYMIEIRKVHVPAKYGIYSVQSYYKTAQKYFTMLKKIPVPEEYTGKRTVTVEIKKPESSKRAGKVKDLDSIFNEGELD